MIRAIILDVEGRQIAGEMALPDEHPPYLLRVATLRERPPCVTLVNAEPTALVNIHTSEALRERRRGDGVWIYRLRLEWKH